MQRAALYAARVSTGRQEKERTIESQLAAITHYAEQHELHHAPALTYTDDGYSGNWLDRPALDELRDHAREGRFDVVVMLCPDRLSRRYVYQVIILEELKRAGVEVLFCERPISDSPDDQLLLQMQGAIAEYERAKLLDRCRRGRIHRARFGELAPPGPPYGYRYGAKKYGGDAKIRLHEDEAAMVRQVFDWYVRDGCTAHRIGKRLNASSWKPRRGKRGWNSSTVQNMLHCEWYVGRAYYNRKTYRPPERLQAGVGEGRSQFVAVERPRSEWIVVPVPRLIDDALFAQAQERVEENRRFSKRRQLRFRAYLLKGLLKCGSCGYSYIGFTQPYTPKTFGQPEYHYYTCSRAIRLGKTPGLAPCQNRRLDVAGVDEAVWTTVRDLLLDSETLAAQLQAWLTRTTLDPAGDERLGLTATRLKEMKRQRTRLVDAYEAGALDLKEFQARKTAVEDRMEAVERERAELQSMAGRTELAAVQVAGATAVVEQLRKHLAGADFELRQAILRIVVDKVVIHGHRLEIHLALPVSGFYDLTPVWGARLPINRTHRHRARGARARGFA